MLAFVLPESSRIPSNIVYVAYQFIEDTLEKLGRLPCKLPRGYWGRFGVRPPTSTERCVDVLTNAQLPDTHHGIVYRGFLTGGRVDVLTKNSVENAQLPDTDKTTE